MRRFCLDSVQVPRRIVRLPREMCETCIWTIAISRSNIIILSNCRVVPQFRIEHVSIVKQIDARLVRSQMLVDHRNSHFFYERWHSPSIVVGHRMISHCARKMLGGVHQCRVSQWIVYFLLPIIAYFSCCCWCYCCWCSSSSEILFNIRCCCCCRCFNSRTSSSGNSSSFCFTYSASFVYPFVSSIYLAFSYLSHRQNHALFSPHRSHYNLHLNLAFVFLLHIPSQINYS